MYLNNIIDLLYTLVYLTVIGIIISIIYGIVELFSHDRVLKTFEGKDVLILMKNTMYYGKLIVPPRSNGGFEVIFPLDRIENPRVLLGFLLEDYKRTKDKKFLKLINDVSNKLGIDYSKIKINPWLEPSLVSRKIYPNDVGNLYAIIRFSYMLSNKAFKKREEELRRIYRPSVLYLLKRRTYNSLTFVKDKINSAIGKNLSYYLNVTPEISTSLEQAKNKLISRIGLSYDSLLENSIGHVVTIEVSGIDGKEELTQGILKDYTSNYVVLYDIDYKFKLITVFENFKKVNGYPKPFLEVRGWEFKFKGCLRLSVKNGKAEIINECNEPIKIDSIKVNQSEERAISRVLFYKDKISVQLGKSISIVYEISRKADIVYPRSKVKVIGLGDYPSRILK